MTDHKEECFCGSIEDDPHIHVKPATPLRTEEWEKLAEQLHIWYLEACQRPESGMDFNPKAQEAYENLPEGSKFLDRYIAKKILELLASNLERVRGMVEEERCKKIEPQIMATDPSISWKMGRIKGLEDLHAKLDTLG